MEDCNKKIFFVCNVDWFFISHRLPIALAAIKAGYKVFLLTADTGKQEYLNNLGIIVLPVPFERSGSNPFHELKCVSILTKYYYKYKPDIIHHITLKASLLGSLAAKCAHNRHVVNAISGLGYNFTEGRDGLLQKVLKILLRVSFRSNYFHFILQNPDDIKVIKSLNLVPSEHLFLIKGSGIDLTTYLYAELQNNSLQTILFPARILKDKGVVELLHAAHSLKTELYGKVKFILAGDCDANNLAVLPEEELKTYLIKDYIEWIGFQKDMYPVYKNSDIVVLPSYREGLPKSLIEACAVGRPIITTDVPGCRECVKEGFNGFLVPAKSEDAIAEAIRKLVADYSLRLKMGENSRKLAEQEFSIINVVETHLKIYKRL